MKKLSLTLSILLLFAGGVWGEKKFLSCKTGADRISFKTQAFVATSEREGNKSKFCIYFNSSLHQCQETTKETQHYIFVVGGGTYSINRETLKVTHRVTSRKIANTILGRELKEETFKPIIYTFPGRCNFISEKRFERDLKKRSHTKKIKPKI